METILVTGVAGFIGSNIALKLLQEKYNVIGIDNINDYYDISLKEYRLRKLMNYSSFKFIKEDISDINTLNEVFNKYYPDIVVNMAAQAGVRYSIDNPNAYIQSNVLGFYNILEACRKSKEIYKNKYEGVKHLIFASSSSVYGANTKIPYSVCDKTDEPVSLYAATKKTNELMAHAYSKLYDIPCTGLRFFTVYGPAGRPDMAYFKFVNKLIEGKKIEIYNYGNCERDFTYIDDIVEGIYRVINNVPTRQKGPDGLPIPPYKVYNIGNSKPVNLLEFVEILCAELKRENILPNDFSLKKYMELKPMQPGDVPITYADVSPLETDLGYKPCTDLSVGLRKFVRWYKEYYN